jgi:hypothetical protein
MGLDWMGLDWTGPDWTGLDWTGLDWTGPHALTAAMKLHVLLFYIKTGGLKLKCCPV